MPTRRPMNVSIHKDRAAIGRGCFLAGKEFLAVVLRTRNWPRWSFAALCQRPIGWRLPRKWPAEWRFRRGVREDSILTIPASVRRFFKNKKKKCLPNAAIPGIPRLRAGTNLLNVGNYVAFRHFQRNRARAGAGPFNIESYESRAGDQEGYCAGDHERTGTSDRERTGTGDDEKADQSDHAKDGASNPQGFGTNICPGAGATDGATKHNHAKAACFPFQLQKLGGQKGISPHHHAVLSEADRLPVWQGGSTHRSEADAGGDDRAGTRACTFALAVLALCQRGIARFRIGRAH